MSKVSDLLEGIATEDILQFIIDEFEVSNALEFCTINRRVKLAGMLLDPSSTDCLKNDEIMPASGVAAWRLLESDTSYKRRDR